MSVQNQRWWGVFILLASCALPLSIREVPRVTLRPDVVDAIPCLGCNPLILGQPLNINKAPIQHLIGLPNIGEKRAKDIVSHRIKFGDFKRLEDLDAVRGIGPKTLARLQPYIVME